MPSKTGSSIVELEQREKRLGKLPLLLDFYLKLLRVQAAVERDITLAQPLLSEAAAGERLGKGEPLLRFRELRLDAAALEKTFGEICRVFAGYPGLFEFDPEILRELNTASLFGPEVLGRWYSKKVVPRKGLPRGLNRPLLADMILSTVKPYLVSYRAGLIDMVRQDYWRRGYCPVCGGMPDLSYLESGKGARRLVCSRCDAEWGFQRMECPYCGNLDSKTLAYYTDESGRYRLYVCDKCRQYLKTVDTRQAGSEAWIPVERLETLDLDRQAREKGYRPGRNRTNARRK